MHTSDWHVGRTIRGRSREHEHARVLAGMLDVVEDERIDLVLVAGDQFDSAVPPAAAERLVWRTLVGFADRGAKVVVIAGNHDHAERLRALAPVLARGGDIVVGAHVQRPDDGGLARVETAAGEVRVALVPFLSQRGIVKTADLLDRDAGQHAQAYAERVKLVVHKLCEGFGSGNSVDLVLAHLAVVGAGKVDDVLGGGERRSHIFDYVVPPQAFPAAAHYAALGHLHQPHTVAAPCPARYCGSPLHLDFGEVASERGVTILEATATTPVEIRHLPLRGGYRLLTLRGTVGELEAQAAGLGNEVYVRAVVDEPPRAGLAEAVRAAVPQAVDVRVAESRRAAEAAADGLDAEAATADPAGLFTQYLAARGVDDARVPVLFRTLLDDLQGAARGDRATAGSEGR